LLLNAAANYLVALRDYRGFDDGVGWRHGVAHAADLLAQLALSPSFGRVEMDRILGGHHRANRPRRCTFLHLW